MNFSSTNFPRSYHAPRDTVTRSRQAVTTVITFLPSFRFVFLSHNQVTILIAFAFLTLDTALSPARFVRRNADPPPPARPPPVENPPWSPIVRARGIRGADLNSCPSPPAFALPLFSLSSRLLSFRDPQPPIFFHYASEVLCFFYRDDDNIATSPRVVVEAAARPRAAAVAKGNLPKRISNGTATSPRANFRSVNHHTARRRPSLFPVENFAREVRSSASRRRSFGTNERDCR